jgi:hypothetical protein
MSTPGPREFAWSAHVSACARCQGVDLTQTGTLGLACFAGAALLKDTLAEISRTRRLTEEELRQQATQAAIARRSVPRREPS